MNTRKDIKHNCLILSLIYIAWMLLATPGVAERLEVSSVKSATSKVASQLPTNIADYPQYGLYTTPPNDPHELYGSLANNKPNVVSGCEFFIAMVILGVGTYFGFKYVCKKMMGTNSQGTNAPAPPDNNAQIAEHDSLSPHSSAPNSSQLNLPQINPLSTNANGTIVVSGMSIYSITNSTPLTNQYLVNQPLYDTYEVYTYQSSPDLVHWQNEYSVRVWVTSTAQNDDEDAYIAVYDQSGALVQAGDVNENDTSWLSSPELLNLLNNTGTNNASSTMFFRMAAY